MANSSVSVVVRARPDTVCAVATGCALIFVSGLVCNAFVISTIWRTRTLRTSSINRAVLSLCVADILSVLADIPLTALIVIGNAAGYAPWSDSAMCHAQTFVHVVVYSVQMLSFPVIGVERYFSIRHPLERQAHLRRVNSLIVATWCFSLALGSLSVALLPTTTVSIYCNTTNLSQEKMHELFLKIYIITFPLGVVCLSVTVTVYVLIVIAVRRHGKRSLATRRGELHPRRKHRSRSGPPVRSATESDFSTAAIAEDGPSIAPETRWARARRRRGSLPALRPANATRRPPFKKVSAISIEDESESGERIHLRVLDNSARSASGLLSPPSFSSISAATTEEKRRKTSEGSSILTEQSSLDDDSRHEKESPSQVSPSVKKHSGSTSDDDSIALELSTHSKIIRQMTAPVIAITLATEIKDLDAEEASSPNRKCSFLLPSDGQSDSSADSPSRRSSVQSQMSMLTAPIEVFSSEGDSTVFRSRRHLPAEVRQSLGPVCSRGDAVQREMGKRRSEAKTAKRSAYIVAIFTCLWLPMPIVMGVSHALVDSLPPAHLQWFLDVQLLVYVVTLVASAAMPVVYGLAIESFRVALVRLLRSDAKVLRRCCCGDTLN